MTLYLSSPMKAKKLLLSAPEWTKTPVWVDEDASVIVDSTPIMIHIDEKYNQGNLWNSDDVQEGMNGKSGLILVCLKPPFQSSMARF